MRDKGRAVEVGQLIDTWAELTVAQWATGSAGESYRLEPPEISLEWRLQALNHLTVIVVLQQS